MTRLSKRATPFYPLLLAIAVLAAFEDFASSDRVPAYRDLLVFAIPFKHFLASRLQRGELPLWNPWIYMGTPFLASLQSGVFYPPSVFFLLPFPLGFNVFLFAHFLVAVSGFWFLSRERGLSAPACAIGSLTFGLGGYLVSTINLTSHLQAAVWLPWCLFFWIRGMRPWRDAYLVLFGLTLTIAMLAGAPEILLMILGVLAGWTAFAAPCSWTDRLHLGMMLGLVLLAALGVAAFQIVPTLEYIGQSDRSGALPLVEVTTWSLQPVSFFQLLLPHSVTPGASLDPSHQILEAGNPWIRSIYLGIVPLSLAIASVAVGRERRFWGTVILVSVVLAFGSATPVFPMLYSVLPGVFGRFRYPEKFYFLTHFATALLASEGAEQCVRGDRRSTRLAHVAAFTFFAVALLLVLARWLWPALYLLFVAGLSGTFAPMTQYVPLAEDLASKSLRSVLLLGCFLGTLWLRRILLLSESTFRAALVALVAVDLASMAHGLNHTVSWRALEEQRADFDVDALRAAHQRMFLYQTLSAPFAGQEPQPIPGLEHWLRFEQQARSFEEAAGALWRTMFFDIPMVREVGTLSGGDGIMRSSDNALRAAVSTASRDRAVKLLRIFGVAQFAGPVPLEVPELEPVKQVGNPPLFIYRVTKPVPAVYLASRLVRAATSTEAFQRMVDPDFIPGVDATVEELPRDWSQASDVAGAGEVRVVTWRDDRVELAVDALRQSFLVLNDSFFPGWYVRVDGQPARIHRANSLARGVAITAGNHRVEFFYAPRSFAVGAAISLATLLAVTIVVAIRRGRRDPMPMPPRASEAPRPQAPPQTT